MTSFNAKEEMMNNSILPPGAMKRRYSLDMKGEAFISKSKAEIRSILSGTDRRLMVIVGPCSIHDPQAAVDYARRLAKLNEELGKNLFLIMRTYLEKPRTVMGWKGLIKDPDLNGSHDIAKGLALARQLLLEITDLGLPVACEILDLLSSVYLSDLISWGAIGARTTESQPHRELASGLPFPVGFKNGTNGNCQVALDAMETAKHSHRFLGIDSDGKQAVLTTRGNSWSHIVLRGGRKPNYSPEDIRGVAAMMKGHPLQRPIMIDCSHGNSLKDHTRQAEVFEGVLQQVLSGNPRICGVMLESNLEAGRQDLGRETAGLKYGVSITDECIAWDTTEELLRVASARLESIFSNGGNPKKAVG